MAFKNLWARNDDADPQFVLPLLVLSLFMGVILTIMGFVLASGGGQETALIIVSGLAVLAWASFALICYKYRRITM